MKFRVCLPNLDELIRLPEWKRLKQDRADDGEYGRVRTDAQSNRQ